MGKIRIGTAVFSKDGLEAGEVDRVVFDPATAKVTHLALRSTGTLTRDIVVPIEVVSRSDDGSVWLDCSVVDLEAMPDYVEQEYVSPAPEELAPGPYEHGDVLFPVARVKRAAVFENDLREGKSVECQDGLCGTVGGVLVDPLSRRTVSFILRHSGALTRDVVVPAEWVLDAMGDRVRLDCNVRQIEETLVPITELERVLGE